MEGLITIARQFYPTDKIVSVQKYGSGNINSTFKVTLEVADHQQLRHFILQQVNTRVFQQPKRIMQNMRTFTAHVCQRLQRNASLNTRRWEVPQVLLTENGADHWLAEDGTFWRALSFIDEARSYNTIQDATHAREIGYALGMFHNLLSDLVPTRLMDTLPGFHITPHYLKRYTEFLGNTNIGVSDLDANLSANLDANVGITTSGTLAEVKYCLQFIQDRSSCVGVLEAAKAVGKLQLRSIHGDPKVNNILIDTTTKQAVSLVDLDTVKPGLVHYDIGDCLRSGCNLLGEETQQWEDVKFELDLCKVILAGYLSVAQAFLTENDYAYLYDGIHLIAFELGLRFFTDYLQGNLYFKVQSPEQNLMRALVQFKLTESIEQQRTLLQSLIQTLKRKA